VQKQALGEKDTERSFYGKLCQEYSKNCYNLIIGFQVTVEDVGVAFLEDTR